MRINTTQEWCFLYYKRNKRLKYIYAGTKQGLSDDKNSLVEHRLNTEFI